MNDFTEKYRDHTEYHHRRLEQQTLDALLRIEEILDRAFPAPKVEPTKAREDVSKGKRR